MINMENNEEAIQNLIGSNREKVELCVNRIAKINVDMAYLSGVIAGLEDALETIESGGE